MGYLKKTAIGVTWLGAIRVMLRGLGFLKTAVIARILIPSQFGLFGIASIVLGFIEIVTETGVNVFLIQEKDKIDQFVDTAWVVSILRGVIIATVIAISAPFISAFYKTPEATPVILAISVVSLIRGFINPSEVKFQKDLEFHKEFYFRATLLLADAIVSITFVVLTHSPMGLVWGMAAYSLAEVVISHVLIKPAPRLLFKKNIIHEIMSRGKWVTFYGIFDYLFSNADNLIVGKFFGVGALGLYDMGYTISILPATEVANLVAKATFPVYVQISHEMERLRRAFYRTVVVMTLLGIPVAVIFYFFPETIVNIVLGSKWLSAAGILRVLALFGVIRAISACANPVFLSLKKQRLMAVITFVNMAILLILIFPFMKMYGLTGAAYAALVASVISLVLTFFLAIKILK